MWVYVKTIIISPEAAYLLFTLGFASLFWPMPKAGGVSDTLTLLPRSKHDVCQHLLFVLQNHVGFGITCCPYHQMLMVLICKKCWDCDQRWDAWRTAMFAPVSSPAHLPVCPRAQENCDISALIKETIPQSHLSTREAVYHLAELFHANSPSY